MAAENGSVTIAFIKQENNSSALSRFIAEKLSSLEISGQYLPDEVCEWSFLEGWNEKRGELFSQLIIYDSIYCVETFCKELIRNFPDMGFCGTLYHDWVNSESSPTQITFMHKKGAQTLLWYSCWWSDEVIEEAFDDFSWLGNVNDLPPTKIRHWSWNAATDKKKTLSETPTQDYYAGYLLQSQKPRG